MDSKQAQKFFLYRQQVVEGLLANHLDTTKCLQLCVDSWRYLQIHWWAGTPAKDTANTLAKYYFEITKDRGF